MSISVLLKRRSCPNCLTDHQILTLTWNLRKMPLTTFKILTGTKTWAVESNFDSSQGTNKIKTFAVSSDQNMQNVTTFRVDQNMFYIILIAKTLKKSFYFDFFLRVNTLNSISCVMKSFLHVVLHTASLWPLPRFDSTLR